MVMTMLQAEVAPDREKDLLAAYRQTAEAPQPPFVLRSFLVRDPDHRTHWRIMTVFRSREELEMMRASAETPRGIQIFQAAGVSPTFSLFEIADQIDNAKRAQ